MSPLYAVKALQGEEDTSTCKKINIKLILKKLLDSALCVNMLLEGDNVSAIFPLHLLQTQCRQVSRQLLTIVHMQNRKVCRL